MKKVLFLIITVVVLSMCIGCASSQGKSGTNIKLDDKMFKTEAGSLTINNSSTSDLIIFAGKVDRKMSIGAIRAGESRNFNLSKIQGLPEQGTLLIRAAAVDSYTKKALITEEDVLYTGLVVYNLNDSGDKTNLNIFKGIDKEQSTFIYVTNKSPDYVLELRLDTPTGEKIATLPPLLENKKIWITPKNDGIPYRFYATFVYVDPKTHEISNFVPKGKEDSLRGMPRSRGENVTPLVFDGPSRGDIAYVVSFIKLKNDTNEGLTLYDGASMLPTQKGVRFTDSGRLDTYEIVSELGETGQLYTNLKLDHDRGKETKINDYVFKPGYMYELISTQKNGNFQYDIREVGQKSAVESARISLFLED